MTDQEETMTQPQAFWPGGAHLAVSVSMMFEAGGQPISGAGGPITEPILDGFPDLGQNTFYEYGAREGVPRILDLMDKHQIKMTSFMIGNAVRAHPQVAAEIVGRGHEAGAHGRRWQRQYQLPRPQETEWITDGVEAIEQATGTRPTGYNNYWIRRGQPREQGTARCPAPTLRPRPWPSRRVSYRTMLNPACSADRLIPGGLTASVGRAGAGADGRLLIGASLVYAFFVGVGVLTCRGSAWTLRIMSELDRSRTVHARLSVAEERLRFARDLHDVLGRNLSLIAVQSELAAQLARRGDQDAGHMLEVRQVAHESLREMRAVVSGYRTADLGTELAGAQEVLRSAGMSCRVIGDAAGLPADVQAALGWVVREGTTNIIRHSDATACTIELHILDSPGAPRAVTLRMDNDRVHALDAGSAGSGLLGLGERLAGLGGSITTGHPRNGHFRLEASLPACGAAAAPPGPGQRGTGITPETPAP